MAARKSKARDPSASLDGITLHVRDLEASCGFYERTPGTRLVAHRQGQFVLFQVGASLLGLLDGGKKPGFHLEVGTPGLEELYSRLVASGVKPEGRPRDRPWGERTFCITDPDGNRIEFSRMAS